MRPIYRISADRRSIHLEHWSSWTAFDEEPPNQIKIPADLAYACGDVRLSESRAPHFEIQRIRVNNGLSAEAEKLVQDDIALWQAVGAQTVGMFQVVHGHDLPAIIVILEWKSLSEAARGESLVHLDGGHAGRYREARHAFVREPIRAISRLVGCTLSLEIPA